MLKLEVKASKTYPVIIEKGFNNVNELLNRITGNKLAVIIDENVEKLFGNSLEFLNGLNVYKYILKSGEESKNLTEFAKIINFLAENEFSRKDTLLAIGGGVTTDLGGFCASTYMRGINLIQMPTTVLACVDASVGGKTAVNLEKGKNLCGTFYQPSIVYINTEFLNTLPKREVESGFGEIIKYAFLSNTVTEKDIKQGISEELIYKCLKIKADIVEKDEKEGGLRKLLNLGHTVGHAVESLSGYKYSHGLSVVTGIYYAIKVSEKLYNYDSEKSQKAYELLYSFGHKLPLEFSEKQLVSKIVMDKKRQKDSVSFVTVKDIGNSQIEEIKLNELESLIK